MSAEKRPKGCLWIILCRVIEKRWRAVFSLVAKFARQTLCPAPAPLANLNEVKI